MKNYEGNVRLGRTKYLNFNVKDTTLAGFNNRGDGLLAGPIEITREFCMLDKSAAVEERREVFTGDKIVLDAVKFSWPWGARGVWRKWLRNTCGDKEARLTRHAKSELSRMFCKKPLQQSAFS